MATLYPAPLFLYFSFYLYYCMSVGDRLAIPLKVLSSNGVKPLFSLLFFLLLMGKSDQFGRSETGWPNRHQAADPKPDGRINIRRPTRSRMAESTASGQHEAGWPSQHQTIQRNIGRSQKQTGKLRLNANGRISIRRPPKPSGRINAKRQPKPNG